MPLDPRISLEAKAPNILDAMNQYEQANATRAGIRQTNQATENMAAQNPGIQAQSQQQIFAAKKQQAVKDITSQYTKTNPDGTVEFDAKGATDAVAKAGYPDAATQIAAGYLDNAAKDITNKFATDNNPTLLSKNKKALDDEVFNSISTIANHITDPEARKQYIIGAMQQAAQRYSIDMTDPRIMAMIKGHTVAVANQGVTPMAERTMAVTEAQLGLQTQRQKVELEAVGDSPEGRDPNSAVSQRARQIAAMAGQPVPDTASFRDVMTLPGVKEALANAQTAQIVQPGARTDAVGRSAELGARINQYNQAIEGIATLVKDDPRINNTIVGTIGGTTWNRLFGHNPKLAGLATSIQVHNSSFPNDMIDPTRMTPAEILTKLQSGASQLQSSQVGANAVSQTSRLPSAPGTPNVNGAPTPAVTPTPVVTPPISRYKKGQRVTTPDGRVLVFNGGNERDPKNWVKQ
jgi:hypothetical protein